MDKGAHRSRRGPKRGMSRGFPRCGRCAIQRDCKARPINRYLRKRKGEVVQYIGIASDEQERLVRLEGVPMTRECLVKIERGVQHIRATQPRAIRDALGVTYDALLEDNGPQKTAQ